MNSFLLILIEMSCRRVNRAILTCLVVNVDVVSLVTLVEG